MHRAFGATMVGNFSENEQSVSCVLCLGSSHVLTEDTIERSVRDGKLYTKRLLSKTNPVPKWGERFYSVKSVKIIEESICDPVEKTFTTYTRNIGLTKVMVSALPRNGRVSLCVCRRRLLAALTNNPCTAQFPERCGKGRL